MKTTADYIEAVFEKLLNAGLEVHLPVIEENVSSEFIPDLVFKTRDGEQYVVEFKDGRGYGQLPLNTGVQLEKLRNKYANVLLVSLSDITSPLQTYLDSIGVKTMVKPSLDEASSKLAKIGLGQLAL